LEKALQDYRAACRKAGEECQAKIAAAYKAAQEAPAAKKGKKQG